MNFFVCFADQSATPAKQAVRQRSRRESVSALQGSRENQFMKQSRQCGFFHKSKKTKETRGKLKKQSAPRNGAKQASASRESDFFYKSKKTKETKKMKKKS
jgi:hypothetical protein